MYNDIKISVIVPVYNVEKFLVKCLDDILAQSFNDYEVILVNDGSVDSSPAICEQYAAKNPKVKVIHQKNGGFGAARNTGMSVARGEYLYFMDSDDSIEPTLLEENYKLAKQGDYDLVLFGHAKIYSTNRFNSTASTIPPKVGAHAKQEVIQQMLHLLNIGCGLGVWELLIKREVIVTHKLHFPTFKREADVAFLLNLYRFCTRVATNNKMYYHYNAFYSQHKYHNNLIQNHQALFTNLIKLIEEGGIAPYSYPLAVKYFVLWFTHVIPVNFLSADMLSFKNKIELLKGLLMDKQINKWYRQLENKKGMLTKVSLFVFGLRNAYLLFLFTKAKLLIKRNLRVNPRKTIYQSA